MASLESLADAVLTADILVVGSEGAGARAVLEASKLDISIIVTTKGVLGKSGATLTADADIDVDSRSASEIFGLPGDLRDSPRAFAEDMVREAEYINDQEMALIHCEEAPERVRELVEWGARIDRLTHAPGHTYPRGVWIPGTEFPRVLAAQMKLRNNIRIIEQFMVTDILLDGDRVAGACGLDIVNGEFYVIKARAIVLCTGGAMRVYPHTTAPEELTGDGLAMAYEAGAELIDMEFPMFLPYTLIKPDSLDGVDFPYLLSAYIDAHALNRTGERYMSKWDPVRMEHSTRDVNAIAAMVEVLDGRGSANNGTYLSLKHLPGNVIDYSAEWFPTSIGKWHYGGFRMKGFLPDLTEDAMETAPAAHFWNGGVRINRRCETSVAGLYAAGEGTGSIMGANRVSGNALTMTQVWGHRAGLFAGEYVSESPEPSVDLDQVVTAKRNLFGPIERSGGADPIRTRAALQELAWTRVGVVRDRRGLEEALLRLDQLKNEVVPSLAAANKSRRFNMELVESIQVRNMATVLSLVASASIKREESRGAQYRRDFPKTDNVDWLKNIVVRKSGEAVEIEVSDVELKYFAPKTLAVREYGRKE